MLRLFTSNKSKACNILLNIICKRWKRKLFEYLITDHRLHFRLPTQSRTVFTVHSIHNIRMEKLKTCINIGKSTPYRVWLLITYYLIMVLSFLNHFFNSRKYGFPQYSIHIREYFIQVSYHQKFTCQLESTLNCIRLM